jgi:two-component system, cell cycle sensor histidine kinase and response regulator CckA
MNYGFAPTNPPRWMVVDDNQDLLLLMRMALEKIHAGCLDCFSSPQTALTVFARAPEKYEMVITDFEMPGMDGIELCHRMRSVARDIKIYLATGSGFFTEEAAVQAGFLGLLNKPFHLEKLCTVLADGGVKIAPAIAT